MQFLKETHIDFLAMRKLAFIVSLVLVIFSLGYLVVRSPRWGIDFTGGSLVHMKFAQPVATADLREMFVSGGIEEFSIQRFAKANVIIVRVKKAYGDADIPKKLSAAIEKAAPGTVFEILRNEMVGPAVGSYLRETAVKAFIFAFAAMIIYIALRFKGGIWGFAAVVALIHDVIITFGILNYMGITIDLPVVAALLTLAGYSINDSIVIYDRIRENIRIHYKKKLGFIINESINSTLSRTIITSGTTLAVVIALFFKGGEVLHGFSTALLFGIIIGTYSSVFVASPLVYVWQNKK